MAAKGSKKNAATTDTTNEAQNSGEAGVASETNGNQPVNQDEATFENSNFSEEVSSDNSIVNSPIPLDPPGAIPPAGATYSDEHFLVVPEEYLSDFRTKIGEEVQIGDKVKINPGETLESFLGLQSSENRVLGDDEQITITENSPEQTDPDYIPGIGSKSELENALIDVKPILLEENNTIIVDEENLARLKALMPSEEFKLGDVYYLPEGFAREDESEPETEDAERENQLSQVIDRVLEDNEISANEVGGIRRVDPECWVLQEGTRIHIGGVEAVLEMDIVVKIRGVGTEPQFAGILRNSGKENYRLNEANLKFKYNIFGALLPPVDQLKEGQTEKDFLEGLTEDEKQLFSRA
jgi:hypothetical protein